MTTALNGLNLLGWVGLWALGGWWLTRCCFHLRENEEQLVGVAVGFILQIWAANLLGALMDMLAAAWAGAALVFIAGLLACLPSRQGGNARGGWKMLLPRRFNIWQWAAVGLLFLIALGIGRGLGIFDDYAHLPTVSVMAASGLPPRFALDPSVPYDYHYFLMVFAAELMRLTSMAAWRTLDIARALTFALALPLTFVWVQRLTHSKLAGLLGALLLAFGTGTRWLLVLLPEKLLNSISTNMQMLGSAAQSGASLTTALTGAWQVDSGPLPFPFAFANGLQSPAILDLLGVNGLSSRILLMILLLTFNRWRGWQAVLLTTVLWSTNFLRTEAGILISLAAWALITVAYMLWQKTLRLPLALRQWWIVLLAGTVIGLAQGGALQGMLGGAVRELVTGEAQASYQTVGFRLVLPPQIVSAHLGVLSLINPGQILIALAEIGPVILVLPLLGIWGWKAFRAGRWYEAAIIVAAFVGIAPIFVEFTGSTGARNTSRLYGFISPCMLFAVPLVWRWAARRTDAVKSAVMLLGVMIMLGGVVLFGAQLPAMQTPVYADFLDDVDVVVERDYWNKLEPDALVFDPSPSRAPTLLGRPTDSSLTWYETKPEWRALRDAPDPAMLHAYGFDYAYYDNRYQDELAPENQKLLEAACVRLLKEYTDWKRDFRRLVDLRGCE